MIERKEAWFPEGAIEYLELYIKSKNYLTVLEFGCGSSTLWLNNFSEIKDIECIEHDLSWYEEVKKGLNSNKTNISVLERPYHEFCRIMNDGYFDICIVDGRDRAKCIKESIPKVKSGGILVLDNSEREYYKAGIDLMKSWRRVSFWQTEPDKYGFTYSYWKCTIFFKP